MSGASGTPKNSPRRLAKWLQLQGRDAETFDRCTLALVYDSGSARDVIYQLKCTQSTTGLDTAAEIIDVAQSDTDARGVRQLYTVELRLPYEEASHRVIGSHALRCKPQDGEGEFVGDSADLRGIVAQMMRHQEFTTQLNGRLIQQGAENNHQLAAQLSKILDSQTRLIEVLSQRTARTEEEMQALRASVEASREDSGEWVERLDHLIERAGPLLQLAASNFGSSEKK